MSDIARPESKPYTGPTLKELLEEALTEWRTRDRWSPEDLTLFANRVAVELEARILETRRLLDCDNDHAAGTSMAFALGALVSSLRRFLADGTAEGGAL